MAHIGGATVPETLPYVSISTLTIMKSQYPIRFVSAIRISDEAVNEFRKKSKEHYENIKILGAISLDNEFTRGFTSTMKEYNKSKILPA